MEKRENFNMSNHQFINNQWVDGKGSVFQSLNPASDAVVWEGEEASEQTVLQAIESAGEAFDGWRQLSFKDRCNVVLAFKEKLALKQLALATVISDETGKPLWETKQEVGAMLGKIDISIEAHLNRCGDTIKEMGDRVSVIRHQPHGIVVVLGPFNFPGHLPNGHIIPALLAGNVVLFKPSEFTPKVAEMMMAIWLDAGLPSGVINMVHGGKYIGQSLVNHPSVKAVFFTGSSAVGQFLKTTLIDNPDKILALEMGGNNPLIVTSYSNVDAVILNIIQSAYITAGQRCTCARRLIVVQDSQTDALLNKLATAIKRIKVGVYTNKPEPFMGPLVQPMMKTMLLQAEADYIKDGAKSLVPFTEPIKTGSFLTPALLDISSVPNFRDTEYFGPMLVVTRVTCMEDALIAANRTKYGLSAGLLSDSDDDYNYFYNTIKAGIVNRNVPTTGASSGAPFGGIKASGNYRPSAYYAADYCSYPVSSIESKHVWMPEALPPGVTL